MLKAGVGILEVHGPKNTLFCIWHKNVIIFEMTKPILVWFGFTAVVRYQAKDIFKFLSGTLQSKGPLTISDLATRIILRQITVSL